MSKDSNQEKAGSIKDVNKPDEKALSPDPPFAKSGSEVKKLEVNLELMKISPSQSQLIQSNKAELSSPLDKNKKLGSDVKAELTQFSLKPTENMVNIDDIECDLDEEADDEHYSFKAHDDGAPA